MESECLCVCGYLISICFIRIKVKVKVICPQSRYDEFCPLCESFLHEENILSVRPSLKCFEGQATCVCVTDVCHLLKPKSRLFLHWTHVLLVQGGSDPLKHHHLLQCHTSDARTCACAQRYQWTRFKQTFRRIIWRSLLPTWLPIAASSCSSTKAENVGGSLGWWKPKPLSGIGRLKGQI